MRAAACTELRRRRNRRALCSLGLSAVQRLLELERISDRAGRVRCRLPGAARDRLRKLVLSVITKAAQSIDGVCVAALRSRPAYFAPAALRPFTMRSLRVCHSAAI